MNNCLLEGGRTGAFGCDALVLVFVLTISKGPVDVRLNTISVFVSFV